MTTKNTRAIDWKELRRWRALELKRDGWTHEEIAEALGVTKGAISQWMQRVQEYGEEGLQARPRKGATPRLTPEQKHLLPEFLSHGAEAYGFRGEVWTAARVACVIVTEFGVSYHNHHVPKLLKELDWTPQKPLEHARQRDEGKIVQWRAEVWKELKKNYRCKSHSKS